MMNMFYSGKTDIGKVRSTNQDSFAVKSYGDSLLVAIVCDGMGGVQGGNVASETAVEHFFKSLESKNIINLEDGEKIPTKAATAALGQAVTDANTAVYKKSLSSKEYSGMGTTLTACIIIGNRLIATNVGDSRLYVDAGKKLTQITQDHSYVQFLIDVGDITPEEAKTHPYRNRITRAIGIQPDVECDIFTEELDKSQNPKILLCSDGLCGQIEDAIMHKTVNLARRRNEDDAARLERACSTLIDKALATGGPDNITAILISV